MSSLLNTHYIKKKETIVTIIKKTMAFLPKFSAISV